MSALILLVVLLVVIGGGWWGWPLAAALFGVKSVNDKAGALSKIVELMRTYDITPAEVAVVFRDPSLIETAPAKRSSGEVAKKLFTYLGAIFILAGIGTYIGMFWNRMGSVMRIVVTLGVGYTLLVVLVSALLVTLFFGGWHGPFGILPQIPFFWFALKTCFFIMIFILLRASIPRPRYDQVMAFSWKFCLPLTLINLLVTGAFVLAAAQ